MNRVFKGRVESVLANLLRRHGSSLYWHGYKFLNLFDLANQRAADAHTPLVSMNAQDIYVRVLTLEHFPDLGYGLFKGHGQMVDLGEG